MKVPFEGGCACGAVRYESSAAPTAMFYCHCRDCQQATGGASSAVVYVPMSGFRFTKGELRHFYTPSERGGQNKRGFCATCGSRISGGESERGIGLNAASLDDPSIFQPTFDTFTDDAQPWDHLDADRKHYPRYPTN